MSEFTSGNNLGKRKLSCRLAELIAASIMNRGNVSKKSACVSEGQAARVPPVAHTLSPTTREEMTSLAEEEDCPEARKPVRGARG